MRHKLSLGTTAALLLVCCAGIDAAALSSAATAPCGALLTQRIPDRPPGSPAGSEFAHQVTGMDTEQRESAIRQQLLEGNIPAFLRNLQPVHLTGRGAQGRVAKVTLCVSPDYLAVGSDQDFFFTPMRLQTALLVASRFRFALPTPKMVDAIYAQAPMHLQPQPLPAGDTMRTTAYYWQHNELVNEQRATLTSELGLLTAGDKKDLVLSNRLWSNPDRVAIYGWHRLNGSAIQPLSTIHGARYADYSHGVRLVSDTAYLNGAATPLLRLLQDSRLAAVLSDEGGIRDPDGLVAMLSAQLPAR